MGYLRGDRRAPIPIRAKVRTLRCRENRVAFPELAGRRPRVALSLRSPMMDNSLICSPKQVDPYGELKIFAGRASGGLAKAICGQVGTTLAASETHIFSDGNIFVRVLENVRGRDVYI